MGLHKYTKAAKNPVWRLIRTLFLRDLQINRYPPSDLFKVFDIQWISRIELDGR